MTFCVHVLTLPLDQRDPTKKDGALHIIGSLAEVLLSVSEGNNYSGTSE